jgi:TonB family protein
MGGGHDLGSPIAWSRVPRVSALFWAIVVHLLLIPLAFLYVRPEKVHIVRPKLEVAELIPRRQPLQYLSAGSAQGTGVVARAKRQRVRFKMVNPVAKPALPVDGKVTLGEQARRLTTDMVANFRFSMIYGFTTGPVYRFAVQRQGQIPRVAPDEVPYEQYVTIEVTIDEAGKVADARMTTGTIPQEVQQKLVSAIRGFRYDPATRDGSPIPSLLDIVIHVPS